MARKKVVTLAVLAVVLTWSTVMTVLGHETAVAVVVPSLGLLVQQIAYALTAPDGTRPADPLGPAAESPGPAASGGQEAPR
ncbi:hypothetical protein [Streptomyces sp. NPDC093094]|uniref:hypothetical protein n=1 Tax=Streptomyces sp. NPDC093094 TaxID=3366026 RepID=UPI0037FBDA0E